MWTSEKEPRTIFQTVSTHSLINISFVPSVKRGLLILTHQVSLLFRRENKIPFPSFDISHIKSELCEAVLID